VRGVMETSSLRLSSILTDRVKLGEVGGEMGEVLAAGEAMEIVEAVAVAGM
jgi:hypothetical protein